LFLQEQIKDIIIISVGFTASTSGIPLQPKIVGGRTGRGRSGKGMDREGWVLRAM
jgi:hypothetical protein